MMTDKLLLTGKERVVIWEKFKAEHPNPEILTEGTELEFGYVNALLEAQLAKVLKHRQDRPELREKIKELLLLQDSIDTFVEKVLVLIPDIEVAKREEMERTINFIESYLVTTVHPEGNIHHIDDREWQSVKLRLLRQALKGEK